MIKHIVMWTLKDFAEGNDKKENAKKIKESLEALKNEISVIKFIEVGINNNDSNVYDVVLNSEFETMEDLDIYQKHPAHVKAGGFVKLVTESRACVDYNMN
ncbi:MAG: Dabb family protein [Clostridium sp.]